MKLDTGQSFSFADAMIECPESDLDSIAELLDSISIGHLLVKTNTDYNPEALFRASLLRDLYNLSYLRLCASLKRDFVFMRFCGLSVSAPKPSINTLIRFREQMEREGLWEQCLKALQDKLNESGLKLYTGIYVTDASLIRPKANPVEPTPKVNKGKQRRGIRNRSTNPDTTDRFTDAESPQSKTKEDT